MLGKLFAIILITLAVSPFTAPFSTCDLTAVVTSHQSSDFMSATKLIQDIAAIPSLGSRSVPVETVEPLHLLRSAVFFSDAGEARSVVLRL
jgi:hypothetical protein